MQVQPSICMVSCRQFVVSMQVNNILTSVAKGMRKEEPDMSVRRAATVALYNAIIFAQTNFENATERNYLMQVPHP